MRLLFSRVGEASAGGSMAYSFNHPAGMCPDCTGIGEQLELVEESMFDLVSPLFIVAHLDNHYLYSAGGGERHLAFAKYRDILDQVSPIVGTKFGDAVGHGFDFGNEIHGLLVALLLLAEAFLRFRQIYFFSIFLSFFYIL